MEFLSLSISTLRNLPGQLKKNLNDTELTLYLAVSIGTIEDMFLLK